MYWGVFLAYILYLLAVGGSYYMAKRGVYISGEE